MRAAVYHETGPPEVFRYEEVPDPPCHPRGVLIDVKAVSIEGGDVLNRAGGAMPETPHIVGYQCAGTIREVGSQVTDLNVGQAVVATMAFGSHAEVVSVPAAAVWPVPDTLGVEEAACVPIAFGTADDCLFEFGRLAPEEVVLVHAAAGGVGVAAVQLAARAGATVLGTASSQEKLERLTGLGLDRGIDYTETDFAAEVHNITDGRGADLIVDPVGGEVLERSLSCLAYRGRLVTVGNAGRDRRPVEVSTLMTGNQSLTGVFLGAEIATPRVRDMITRHLEAVAGGELNVVVDRTFPLAEAASAHRYIESRQAFGRVLLIP